MTEEYKKNLLKYLTNRLGKDEPNYDEIFEEIIEVQREDWLNYIPSSWANMHIEGLINSTTNGNCVLYGGYLTTDNQSKGMIILIDNNFNPIKSFYQFDNGTELRYIQHMEQAEDNTFYFIDDTCFTYNTEDEPATSEKRFVMVNDFTINNNDSYLLSFRTSYIIPDNYKNIYCQNALKSINSSHYVFVGKKYYESGNAFSAIAVIELKVNVGIENEWNYWATDPSNKLLHYGGSVIFFDENDNVLFRILGDYYRDEGTFKIEKGYNDSTWSINVIYNSSNYNDDEIDTDNYTNQCVFTDINNAYFVMTNQKTTWSGGIENKHIALLHYNFETSQIETIFDKDLGKNPSTSDYYIDKEAIYLSVNDGKLYILYCEDDDEDNLANYYLFRYEGKWAPILIAENKTFVSMQRGFYVNNDYNLLKMFCFVTNLRRASWYFPIVKEIYNDSNYNGRRYIGDNSLVQRYSNLYSNKSLIFSRNLYNKLVQNNSTVSSVEIPNNYLNNVIINESKLISETNLEIINDNTSIEKNIYEIVDINFINTLNIINSNNPNDEIINIEGSARLNNSVSNLTDYDNAKLYKSAILYYQDGSKKEIKYNFDDEQDNSINIIVDIYIDKLVDRLELVSSDNLTVYQTIDLSNLILNKMYRINQKVEVV